MTRAKAIEQINAAKQLLADLRAANAPARKIVHQRRNVMAQKAAFARMDEKGEFDGKPG